MKKIIIQSILFFALVNMQNALGQKIETKKVDEFTSDKIIETNYNSISDGFPCRLKQINDEIFFQATYNCGSHIYCMDENAEFLIKLDNDEIVKLSNFKYSVAEFWSTYIGSTYLSHYNLYISCFLDELSKTKLQKNYITKVRFYTTDGYIEKDVNKNRAKKLLKMFNLL